MQVEASSALNGVGLVRLMGRSSGFIAMEASLASGARPETFPLPEKLGQLRVLG